MAKPPPLLGLHHVTAIARDAQENLFFYRDVLGLRLVKKTVNFDDPGAYHFYFADEAGSPGSVLTFFPWEGLPPRRPGANEISAAALTIAPGSLGEWAAKLHDAGRSPSEATRFGQACLTFNDPHGMTVDLSEALPGETTPQLGPPTLAVAQPEPLAAFLTGYLGFTAEATEGPRRRFRFTEGSSGALDILATPDAIPARQGVGAIHHVALRVADQEAQLAWLEYLGDAIRGISPVRDRQYFSSIYFPVPGNILFEIATDPPGFAVDEPPESLGEALKLPPAFEPHRQEIERVLPPVH